MCNQYFGIILVVYDTYFDIGTVLTVYEGAAFNDFGVLFFVPVVNKINSVVRIMYTFARAFCLISSNVIYIANLTSYNTETGLPALFFCRLRESFCL